MQTQLVGVLLSVLHLCVLQGQLVMPAQLTAPADDSERVTPGGLGYEMPGKPGSYQLLPAGFLHPPLSRRNWLLVLVLACLQAALALGTDAAAVGCLSLALQPLVLQSGLVLSSQQQFAVGYWGQFLQLLVVLLPIA